MRREHARLPPASSRTPGPAAGPRTVALVPDPIRPPASRSVLCGFSLLRFQLPGAGSWACSAGRPSSEGAGFGVLEGEGCLHLVGRTCDCWDGGFHPCPELSATWKLVTEASDMHHWGGAGSSTSFGHFSVGLLCPPPPPVPAKGWRDLEGWPRPLLGRVLSLSLQRDSTGRACVTCSWLFRFGINVKTEEAPPRTQEQVLISGCARDGFARQLAGAGQRLLGCNLINHGWISM